MLLRSEYAARLPLYPRGDWKLERVMSFEALLQTGLLRCRFMGLTQDGSPNSAGHPEQGEVYLLDLDLP
jgi:hypothetical protein